jgi:hypothetical protein
VGAVLKGVLVENSSPDHISSQDAIYTCLRFSTPVKLTWQNVGMEHLFLLGDPATIGPILYDDKLFTLFDRAKVRNEHSTLKILI